MMMALFYGNDNHYHLKRKVIITHFCNLSRSEHPHQASKFIYQTCNITLI